MMKTNDIDIFVPLYPGLCEKIEQLKVNTDDDYFFNHVVEPFLVNENNTANMINICQINNRFKNMFGLDCEYTVLDGEATAHYCQFDSGMCMLINDVFSVKILEDGKDIGVNIQVTWCRVFQIRVERGISILHQPLI